MNLADNQRKKIHAMLTDLKNHVSKDEVVSTVTDGRTRSLKGVTYLEGNLIIKMLTGLQEEARKKMRGSIIYHLCTGMGMTDRNGDADWTRINRFIQGIGSRNPRKKKLFNLSIGEMRDVLTQVQMMVKKELRR